MPKQPPKGLLEMLLEGAELPRSNLLQTLFPRDEYGATKGCPCERCQGIRAAAKKAGEDALAEALRPFGFFSDEPNTTQQAWEIRYCDRFEDWIDFGDMESARDALAAYEARREK